MSQRLDQRLATRFPRIYRVLLARLVAGPASSPIRRGVLKLAMRGRANPTLEQFRAYFLVANDAYNRGDFVTAFSGLAPECEWHPFADAPERVLVGPEQVCHYFEEIVDSFPDWHNEPVHFLEAGSGVFVVLHRAKGTARASGVPTGVAHAGVWELRDGIPVRVREYYTWEEALTAAGLDTSIATNIRRRRSE